MDEQTGSAPQGIPDDDLPRDDQPGGESTPRDTEGAGPVTLEDRTRERGGAGSDSGAPAANQAKAEPIPSSPEQREPGTPLAPPLLGDMNVGSSDPQSPRHPAAAGSGLSVEGAVPGGPTGLGGPGTVPFEDRPLASAGSSTGRASGPENPVSSSTGTAHLVPGLQGSTGPDEAVETDVEASAARMGPAGPGSVPADDEPGNSQGVPVPGTDAARGTSEEHGAVRGARTPTTD